MPRRYPLLLKFQAGRTQDLAEVRRLLRSTSATERAEMRAIVLLGGSNDWQTGR